MCTTATSSSRSSLSAALLQNPTADSLEVTPPHLIPPFIPISQILVALITIDVHNRDIVESLVLKRCTSKSDFTWQMQLRYEYDQEAESVVVRQVQAR